MKLVTGWRLTAALPLIPLFVAFGVKCLVIGIELQSSRPDLTLGWIGFAVLTLISIFGLVTFRYWIMFVGVLTLISGPILNVPLQLAGAAYLACLIFLSRRQDEKARERADWLFRPPK